MSDMKELRRTSTLSASERGRREVAGLRVERLLWLVGLMVLLTSSVQAQKPLTVSEARVLVTGSKFNRPDPFPGRGEFSWPGNINRGANNELLLVISAGYYHVSFAQPRNIEAATRKRWLSQGWPLDFAAPTGGRCMITRSTDNGKTWTKPSKIIDLPWDDVPYGLLRLRDGTLLAFINVQASWYGYPKAPASHADQLDGLNTQQCLVRSIDNGKTWSKPIWLKSPGNYYERSHAQPIQLGDGTILWPTYFMKQGSPKLYGAIHESLDGGKTWSVRSVIERSGDTSDTASQSSANIDEPAIAELKDGRLIALSRPDGAVLMSNDKGKSWKFQRRLVTKGKFKAPRLFVLSDNTIVCVATYGNLRVFIGKDGGKEWLGPLPLDTSCYGYPGGLLLQDESMLVSYCSSGGAPNNIYALRFRLNKTRDKIEYLKIDQ